MGRKIAAAGAALALGAGVGATVTGGLPARAEAAPARALNTVETPRLNFYCPANEFNPITGQRDLATLAGSIAVRQVPDGSFVEGEWRLSAGDEAARIIETDGDVRFIQPGETIVEGNYKTNVRGTDDPYVYGTFSTQVREVDATNAILSIDSGNTSPADEKVKLPESIYVNLKCNPTPPPPGGGGGTTGGGEGGRTKVCPVEMTDARAKNAFSKTVVKEGGLVRLFYSAANPYDTPLKAPRAVISIPSGFTIAVKNSRLRRINPNTDQWAVKVNPSQPWRKNKNIYGSILLRASDVNRDKVRSSRFSVVAKNPFGTEAICRDAIANSSAAVRVLDTPPEKDKTPVTG